MTAIRSLPFSSQANIRRHAAEGPASLGPCNSFKGAISVDDVLAQDEHRAFIVAATYMANLSILIIDMKHRIRHIMFSPFVPLENPYLFVSDSDLINMLVAMEEERERVSAGVRLAGRRD